MNRFHLLFFSMALVAAMAALGTGIVRADGKPGTVEWSDGHKITGDISLTPGEDLLLFTNGAQVSLQLDEVKEIRFKPEKEEMQEGFYFPNAGQATQAKTGDVYPVRELQTAVTLSDGKVLAGHLFTTVLYVDTDDATEKVVLMAKQTGTNGQKLTDLLYPTDITFDAGAPSAGAAQIDLTQAGLTDPQQIIAVTKPDLGLLPATQLDGKLIWTVPIGNPKQILFAVQAADGIHVAWPADAIPGSAADPDIQQAVQTSLKAMQDFYDTRTLLGCFAEDDDIYSLVMMKRLAKSVDGSGTPLASDILPWSLVVLHWKYDPDQKKVTLLNRSPLGTRQLGGNSPPPTVFKEAGLLLDISALPATTQGTNP